MDELTPKSLSESIDRTELDLFRDALSNVNQTLRFQISLAVPLLAACLTVLNIIPPQAHQEFINMLDRYVFVPVIVSICFSWHGLEHHWYHDKNRTRPLNTIEGLYTLVAYKYKMARWALGFQGLGLALLGLFILLEYK